MWDSKYFSLAYVFPNFSSADISVYHYALFIVTLIGIILALFNEDSASGSIRLSWITYEFLPMPETHIKQAFLKPKVYSNKSSFLKKVCEVFAFIVKKFTERSPSNLVLQIFENIQWFREVWKLKRHAIKKGETEMKSYLDAKRHMIVNNNWPFFWSVKEVRNKFIECEGYHTITMSSYSYLDLLRNEEVQEAAISAAQIYSTGNHGPRMLGGGSKILRDLEKKTGRFFGREDSLVFATGYLACMSAPAAVCKKGDLIVYDSRSHASLRAGIKLSEAKSLPFAHNNFLKCEELLRKNRYKYRSCWIVMESVYSMDGDIGDLPSAYNLSKTFNCQILLDEAHGLGVLGDTGRGLEEFYNLPGVCNLIVGTYSKSIGGIGGYIVGSNDMVQFLDFHSPGSLFSAPLTAYSAGGALKAFEIIERNPEIVKKLHQNIKTFREILKRSENLWPQGYPDKLKFVIEGNEHSSVIPVVYPSDPDRVFRVAILLRKRGYMVSAVAYPACPASGPRLRITVTTNYEETDMVDFVESLIRVTVECQPRMLISSLT